MAARIDVANALSLAIANLGCRCTDDDACDAHQLLDQLAPDPADADAGPGADQDTTHGRTVFEHTDDDGDRLVVTRPVVDGLTVTVRDSRPGHLPAAVYLRPAVVSALRASLGNQDGR